MRQCSASLEASAPTGYERRKVHQAELTTASASDPFDARGPFLLSLFMTLVGYSVLVALPAINSARVDQLGFTEVEVNRGLFDLLGFFIGAVLTSFLIRLGAGKPHLPARTIHYCNGRAPSTSITNDSGPAGRRTGLLHRGRGGRFGGALQAKRCVQLDALGFRHLTVSGIAADTTPVDERHIPVLYRYLRGHPAFRATHPQDASAQCHSKYPQRGATPDAARMGGHWRNRHRIHQYWCLLVQH